ncbi:hypothetical protein BDF20DRAFT_916484 [Mycotypha africana]|uniref:uncharacterized protein n=1 Tax=Mycotypha africana TaxID=64632 RepID=UPI00230176A2|nr:uncharacterized protein BDF20DRAFT_916484 [Mycotypha africana]KAI8969089.1 hypothetical protein BDF20DRAFT_916484 [Mycotypha africana]
MSWVTIVHLTIYNLIKNAQIDNERKPKKDRREHFYFRWKDDVCAFIDDYWEYFTPGKQRSITWNNTIASVLSTHSTIFLSGIEKFHQSAWWTLHEIAPPTGEKKSKMVGTRKPIVRKSLKRSRPSPAPATKEAKEDGKAIKTRSVKRHKKYSNDTEDDDLDAFDMSSLSELSSADELLSDEDTSKEIVEKQKPSKPNDAESKIVDVQITRQAAPASKEQQASDTAKASLKKGSRIASTSTVVPNLESTNKITTVDESRETLSDMQTSSPAASSPIDTPQESKKNQIPAVNTDTLKPTLRDNQSAQPSVNVNSNKTLTSKEEWLLLQKLEHSTKRLTPAARRYKRKLAVRRLKRSVGIKLFDIDHHMLSLLRMQNHILEPISTKTVIQPAFNQHAEVDHHDDQQQLLDKISFTPYASSFASRLYGSIRQRHTITRDEPWLSSWNGRKLRPFIRRDFETKPKRMLLLGQIKACNGKPVKKGEAEPSGLVAGDSIDYVYFQKEHLVQVNSLLCRSFWEGIDASESLLFPEFSIVALYKRHVIGCAFMTPEAYITYFAVDSGWRNANIGQFMLYHLFQTAISKDITLHVSANNNAMILYQKFGFKPEEFIVNFYDKYYPADSVYSKNAFFLRLRR